MSYLKNYGHHHARHGILVFQFQLIVMCPVLCTLPYPVSGSRPAAGGVPPGPGRLREGSPVPELEAHAR